MYGPQLLEGVRTVVRGSGEIAPTLDDAWPHIAGGRTRADDRHSLAVPAGVTPGLLVLRSPPVAWEDHATLAGDPSLVRALRASASPPALLLPVPEPAHPEPESGCALLRRELARSLADLWRDQQADDAQRREVVSAARAANRVGRRLRRLRVDGAPGVRRSGAAL